MEAPQNQTFGMNKLLIIIVSIAWSSAVMAVEEQLHLTTDRSIYISGEPILFSCALRSEMQQTNLSWSEAIYIQLINAKGEQWTKQVVKTLKHGVEGQLNIPQDIPSGYYLLQAETSWMRNMTIQLSSVKVLKIINPSHAIPYVTPTNDTILPQQLPIKKININLDDSVFTQRDSMQISISLENDKLNQPNINYVVSVTPMGSNAPFETTKLTNTSTSDFVFYPESQGMILSGKVIKQNKPTTRVNISFFRDELGSYIAYTDSMGNFRMGLPYEFGAVEAFAYCEDTSTIIKLISQYRQITTNLPEELDLSTAEQTLLQQMNFQASVHYKNTQNRPRDTKPNNSFYGTPNYSIIFSEYIELPSLQEYFSELFPSVSIRKENDRNKVKIGNAPYSNPIFEPLLLLDMLKISNISQILSLQPEDIHRIEVIDQNYRLGGQTYSGIISVFSKNNDFAKQKIPKNGFFFAIDLYSSQKHWRNIGAQDLLKKHLPLNKNCLYWDTNLSAADVSSLTIFTGDSKGEFEITVTGISENGDVYKGCKIFTVE